MARMKARGRAIAALLAVMMVTALLPVLPAYAASDYSLKYLEAPRYVANDHTPFGIRISADASSGLPASTTFYVRIRFSKNQLSPSSSNNRGWIWNPTTGLWAQERGDWIDGPTVSTDASGAIGQQWFYGKFGDETKAGTYYIQFALSETGSATTWNPFGATGSIPPTVTVMDVDDQASWVHNGTELTNSKARVAVRTPDSALDDDADPSSVLALFETELNGCDDDGNLAADDEDYGPVGVTGAGDYRVAVESSTTVDIYTKRGKSGGTKTNDFVTGPAGCDIAVGAADMTPPTAVTGLTVDALPGAFDLEWNAASDGGGSGLDGYMVYRRPTLLTEPDSVGYATNPPELIGYTSDTTFSDSDVVANAEYEYWVRAVDADTNSGPRSNVVTIVALPGGAVDRDAGADRYATALAISQSAFPDDSVDTTVVIATGRDYPDALAASGLAGVHGSPLLLVGTSLSTELKAEIDRLGATDVVLVGGTAAIPAAVENALKAYYDVKRVSGSNRYATAAAVARELEAFGGNTTEAYFVRGDGFADALAVSPFAYAWGTPVLLVQTGSVPGDTVAAIDDLDIDYGMIAGGTSAVSQDVEDDLETFIGAPLDRWAGVNRYATAALVADSHVQDMYADYGFVGIATGVNFADALGGGAAAGYNGGVLLLTAPSSLSAETQGLLVTNTAVIDEVRVYGGSSAVSPAVYSQIEAALQ